MSRDPSDLPERIRALADDELLRIVYIEAADYRPETLEIAQQEIRRRGLPGTSPLSVPEPAVTREPTSWTCSKCGESNDRALQACWNCGTSLDGVEDLNFVPSARAVDTTSEPRPSGWTCPKCGESIEVGLQVCWKCGTSVDGLEDPQFRPQEAPPSDMAVDIDSQIAERFRCPKCSESGADVKRIATTGTGLSKLIDLQHNQFLAVSCRNCGFTELYDPEVLEGKRVLGSILDLLFG